MGIGSGHKHAQPLERFVLDWKLIFELLPNM